LYIKDHQGFSCKRIVSVEINYTNRVEEFKISTSGRFVVKDKYVI